MKTCLLTYLLLSILATKHAAYGQESDIVLQSGIYQLENRLPDAIADVREVMYVITVGKSAYTFTRGQFEINVDFPEGVVYAGDGGTIPPGFEITSGEKGASGLKIGIKDDWGGTGPDARLNFVLPVLITSVTQNQSTSASISWFDSTVTENPAGNRVESWIDIVAPSDEAAHTPYKIQDESVNGLSDSLIYVYPNPVSGLLKIGNANQVISVALYDRSWKKLFSLNGTPINDLNLKAIAEGVYFVKITSKESKDTIHKIMIIH